MRVASHVPTTTGSGHERVLTHPLLDGLFLVTILAVTFRRLQWELADLLRETV